MKMAIIITKHKVTISVISAPFFSLSYPFFSFQFKGKKYDVQRSHSRVNRPDNTTILFLPSLNTLASTLAKSIIIINDFSSTHITLQSIIQKPIYCPDEIVSDGSCSFQTVTKISSNFSGASIKCDFFVEN